MKVQRTDRISLALHREVVKCLDRDPSLWEIARSNLDRWEAKSGCLSLPHKVWRGIIETWPREKIRKLLLSKSQQATLLRSSSPFAGIIDEETRARVFKRYPFTGCKPFAYL